MTDKQEKILEAALELIAKQGYRATSTNKIAKHAGVSEGLIFRHFRNKEGLLEAIMEDGKEKAKLLFADIVFEEDPKTLLRKTLDLGNTMLANKETFDYWKMLYKVKWEIEMYAEKKMEHVEFALTNAFAKLGYESPEMEAKVLLLCIDGLATKLFLQKNVDISPITEFLKTKYNL